MSFFTEFFSTTTATDRPVRSGIRGATGLSRAVLAEGFRRDGLFGRDSDLSSAEQAAVQSQIGPVAGLRSRPVLAPIDSRLQALAAYTRAVVVANGATKPEEAKQLVAAGFTRAAASEVGSVVRNVCEVFGPQPRVCVGDARLGAVPTARLARAA
ncbi:MAG: hypothetical protein ACT4PZ_07140 [Panacagrimonas sp.]